jgi:hypothetical protein
MMYRRDAVRAATLMALGTRAPTDLACDMRDSFSPYRAAILVQLFEPPLRLPCPSLFAFFRA